MKLLLLVHLLMLVCAAPVAVETGHISDKAIDEASGVIASRQYPGVFWTHNDGADGVLYAIRRDGSLISRAELDVKVHDWEDIAIDEKGNLYVADTGNNENQRKTIAVH